MISKPYTLYVRLNTNCNADCSYCSSWKESHSQAISFHEFKKSLTFIYENYWVKNNRVPQYITLNFIGGEILLYNPEDLASIVNFAESFFKDRDIKYRLGAQSNLIGSKRRLDNLKQLFGDNIGTSVDDISNERTVNGSNDKYKKLSQKGQSLIATDYRPSPAVFTITNQNVDRVTEQYEISKSEQRSIGYRHVFSGGSDVELITPEKLTVAYTSLLDRWEPEDGIVVQPLLKLIQKRLQTRYQVNQKVNLCYCPFQSDCTSRTLSLEPNGDLFLCQEMADAGYYPLGNAIHGKLKDHHIKELDRRPMKLDQTCYQCEYFNDCQGGCALESIQFGNGIHGKTKYCKTWKSLFKAIDEKIDNLGVERTRQWVYQNDQ